MRLLIFVATFSVLSLSACKNAPERPEPILSADYQPPAVPTTPDVTTTPTPTNEPPQNAFGVWHYTCSNGCAGGAGGATPCAVCGTTLIHNQTYHDNTASVGQGSTQIESPDAINLGATATGLGAAGTTFNTEAPTKTPEPAQNAAGVWHYTCSAGCAGGAGSAVACSGCGKTLEHNQGYH